MSRSTFTRAALAIALLTTSGMPRASGGDGFEENIYAPEYQVPASELSAYAAGKPGIVVPSYWRVYHFLAYRALTGHALSKDELAALDVRGDLVGAVSGGYDYAYRPETNGVGAWLKARAAVHGAPEVTVGVDTDLGDFTIIINCPADAFARAAKTLGERLERGGQQWGAAWLANQDAVFANCSPKMESRAQAGAPVPRPLFLPSAPAASAPAWLRRDFNYQRAAAHFYAGRYDEARQQFLDIARDGESPWQPLGNYLAARALIRGAVAVPGAPEGGQAQGALRGRLAQARAEMAAIAADYAPARGLLAWLDVRVRPEERRRELSAALAVDAVGAATPQMLTDYLVLMDKLEPAAWAGAADPMTAWIGAMQAGGHDRYDPVDNKQLGQRRLAAVQLARTHWNQRHEAVWLLALLTNARGGDLKPAESKAAAAVKPGAPAYVALQYHLARLALAEGRTGAADAAVSALLDQPQAHFVRNRLLRMKMVVAASAEASLAAAARTVAVREGGVPVPDEGKPGKPDAQYDVDLRAHLETHFPLATLARIKPLLAQSEQARLADMMWTRAVLLGQYALADGLTDELARERATTRHLYQRYKGAATPEGKRDAALLILVNAPELVPHVSVEAGAEQGAAYWSCAYRQGADDGMDQVTPAFVTGAERAQLDQERAQLRKLPKRSAYLVPRLLEWVAKNKADPEAPKALHFLVASTRNECAAGAPEAQGRNHSKDAFNFLHQQYPKSEWTAKTRYYY